MLSIPYSPLPDQQDDVEYCYGPDSFTQDGVVPGRVVDASVEDPPEFPGTSRSVRLYIPSGIPLDRPVAATVILDGTWYLDPHGAFRAGTVLDNLVATGAIPSTVGVFVDAGVFPDVIDPDQRNNRNAEYDAPDDRFATLLAERVLPLAAEHVPISLDSHDRLICGGSSGGNAAFTAAWHRPDVFGRVVCLGGSFAQMPGGNPYPDLIAATPRKPLRVLLTAAHRDLRWNEPDDNWFAENLLVAAALAKAGYDMRLVLREGGHSMVNGGSVLPDALRWAWTG